MNKVFTTLGIMVAIIIGGCSATGNFSDQQNFLTGHDSKPSGEVITVKKEEKSSTVKTGRHNARRGMLPGGGYQHEDW